MELTALLNYILGGTSLAGIIGTLFYYKHNKKLKQNEVEQSDTKTQSEQINLGMQFIESAKNAAEIIQNATQNTDSKIDELTKTVNTKMSVMSRNQVSMNKKLKMMEKYLNGSFQEFIAAETKKEAKK